VVNFISKTKITYALNACFIGTDSFQFTLANAYGTSNVATATITINPVSAPTTAVRLVDPFLLGKVISNFDQSNIDLTPLFRVQKWATVQANGLLADNTSAAIAVIQTNDCANDESLTTTNGTTLADYSPDFLNKTARVRITWLTHSRRQVAKYRGLSAAQLPRSLRAKPTRRVFPATGRRASHNVGRVISPTATR
jgi:hypothetical protein